MNWSGGWSIWLGGSFEDDVASVGDGHVFSRFKCGDVVGDFAFGVEFGSSVLEDEPKQGALIDVRVNLGSVWEGDVGQFSVNPVKPTVVELVLDLAPGLVPQTGTAQGL